MTKRRTREGRMAFEKAFDQNLGTGRDVSEEDVNKILKERFNGAPAWESKPPAHPGLFTEHVNQVVGELYVNIDAKIKGLFKEAFEAGMAYEDDLEIDFDDWFAAFVERLKHE